MSKLDTLLSMSQALREYRRKNGIPLDKLAAEFGIQKSGLCKWECRGIPPIRVPEVSEKTGIPAEQLRPDIFRASRKSEAA